MNWWIPLAVWRRWWRARLERCDRCGRPVDVVWCAEDELWNEICGEDRVLCVRCFDRRCAARGIVLTWEPFPL